MSHPLPPYGHPALTIQPTVLQLSEYAEMYFTSNATMVFLPGDHILDRNITVANVARLTMRRDLPSSNIATIVCNGSVGFNFLIL